jgi:tight adherence protein C
MAFQLSNFVPQGMRADDFLTLLAVGGAFISLYAIYAMMRERDEISSKIKAIQDRRKELQGELAGPRKRRKPEASVNFMRSVAVRFELIKKLQVGKAQTTLIEAGYRSKDAIYIFAFFNLALPIVLGIIGFIAYEWNIDTPSKWKMMHYIWPILGAYMGLKLPWFFLNSARKKRYLKIQRSLSDVLDLMTICAEAGLSLAAALDRVSKELRISYPEMAEELELTSIEIGFLPDRNKALSNLAERCQLPEVRGIVSVLIQTEKYGTPIAQALRVLSAEFRQARMLRAEQKAARLPALMTVPMIIFILPTLFIIIISPAVVKLMDTLGK